MKKFGALEEKYYFRSQNEEGKKIINRILHFCGYAPGTDIINEAAPSILVDYHIRSPSQLIILGS